MYYMTCVTVLLFTDAIKVMFFCCVFFHHSLGDTHAHTPFSARVNCYSHSLS